ncbi:MAG: efflux RND transporter permease subunit, partial [Verrucomicrobiota bacterium]
WLGLTWDRPFHELVEYVDLHLKDKFMVVPGVGDIQLGGWSNRAMRVWVDNEKLKKYELTVLDIRDSLKADYTEVASGYTENNKQQVNIRTMGEERSAQEIANLPISRRGGKTLIDSPIHIRDVATVEDGLDDIRRFSRADGRPSVGLGIRKQQGFNDVQIVENVKKLMVELNKTLPPGMELNVRFDQTKFTKDSVQETELTLLLSVVVTGLVCWMFLGSWSPTLNVLLSIPTSLLGTFVFIYFCGFTLNFFTLLGLTLAIGIVVDDAIMVLENIFRHFQMGKDRVQASLDGTREITFAAIAATVSVVAIFSPVLFINGMIGIFLYQFGMTISAAVLLSLLEAITLTPMRCSQFMEHEASENRFTKWVSRRFHDLGVFYG